MRVIRWLNQHFEEALLTILLIIMVLVMGYQVAMRYIFNNSLPWSEELTRYLFVWSAFLSIGYCIKHHSSIKIDQLLHLMPPVAQKVLLLLSKIISLFFFAYVLRYSFNVVQATINSGQLTPALQIPMYFVHYAAVVGFGLAVYRILESFIRVAAKNVEEEI
jgi:TRAP-type C4-dicarboxylate transport system permease small subunit